MGFLNRAFTQLNDLFKSLTPGTRIVAVLLLASVVIAVAFLFAGGVSGGGSEFLLAGADFSADEMPAMQAALGKANLSFQVEGARIRIPKGQSHAYTAALAKEGALPANYGDYLEKAAASDPLATGKTLEQRRQNALQRELRLTLRGFDGVLDATVLLDEKKGSGLSRKPAASASVAIRMKGNHPLTEDLAETIRKLVASAAGLDFKHVVVTDQQSHVAFGGDDMGGSAAGSEYLRTRQRYIQDYESKILKALRYVTGVSVVVDVELNPEVERQQRDLKADPKTVPVRQEESTQETKSESGGPGGRPGVAAQASGNQAARLDAKGVSSSTKGPNSTIVESVVSTTQMDSRRVGLTPIDVRALVTVPLSYIDQEWRSEQKKAADATPSTPEEKSQHEITQQKTLTKIREHLLKLVPDKTGTEDPTPNVSVEVFRDAPIEPIAEEGLSSQAIAWFGANWSTVGMFGLAAFGLLAVRSLARAGAPAPQSLVFEMPAASNPAAVPAKGATPAKGAAAAPAPVEETPPQPTLASRRRRTGLSLRDELVELVREDPETAAGILRSWIGSAN